MKNMATPPAAVSQYDGSTGAGAGSSAARMVSPDTVYGASTAQATTGPLMLSRTTTARSAASASVSCQSTYARSSVPADDAVYAAALALLLRAPAAHPFGVASVQRPPNRPLLALPSIARATQRECT